MSLVFLIVRLLDIHYCVLQKVGIFLTAFFKSKFQAISTRFPPYLLKIWSYLFFKCFDSAYNRLEMDVLASFGSEESVSSGCKLVDHVFGLGYKRCVTWFARQSDAIDADSSCVMTGQGAK